MISIINFIRHSLLYSGLFLAAGCSVLDVPIKAYTSARDYVFPPGEKLHWKSLDILMREDANSDYPLEIDIALIKNEKLLKKILELNSTEWFEQKKSISRIFAEDIIVKSWELAPGDIIKVSDNFFQDKRVFGAIVFANYLSDGDYRVRLEKLKGVVVVEFDNDEFNAYVIKPN